MANRVVSWVLTASDRTGAAFSSLDRNLRRAKMSSDDTNSSLSSLDEAGSRAANGLDNAGDSITRSGNSARRAKADTDSYRGSIIEMAQASGFLAAVMRQLRFPIIVSGINLAAQAVGTLTAAVLALAGALGPTIGLLAALPAAAATVGQGFSVARLATNGLLNGLKALETDSLNSGRAAVTSGRRVEQSLRRQEAAMERVRSASRSLERAQIGAADTIAAADRRIADATRRLANTQEDAQRAQERLTEARRRASERIEDMRRRLAGLSLSEEEAVFALRDAARELEIAELWRPYAPSDETFQRADLAHRQALHRLQEIRDESQRTSQEVEQADREGVDGADEVQDALRGIEEATQRIADATRELGEAQEQASRDQRDAADSVAEAQHQLALAIRDSEQAMEDFGETAATAGSKAATAFDKLNPAAQRFARFLFGLNPMLDRLRDAAGNALFPQLETAITNLLVLFPLLLTIVGDTAGALGGLAVRASELMTSGPFAADFATLAAHNVTIIDRAGTVALNLMDALRSLMIAAMPLVDWLVDSAVRLSEWINRMIQAGRETGRLQRFFEQTRQVTQTLINIVTNLGVVLYNILRGGADLGRDMLGSLERITAEWREWSSSAEGSTAIRDFFNEMRPALHELALLVRDVARGFAAMTTGPEFAAVVAQIREQLLPAFLRLADTTSQAFTTEFIETLTHLMDLFTQLSGQQGALTVFLSVLGDVFRVLAWAIENIPGMQQVLTWFIIFRGVMAAFTVINFLTGIGGIIGLLPKLGLAIKGVGAAFTFLMGHPIVAFLVGIALVALLVINNWDTVKRWFEVFAEFVTDVVGGILGWLSENWPTVLAILAGPIGIAVLMITRHFDTIKEAVMGVANFFQDNWRIALTAFLTLIGGPFGTAIGLIISNFGTIREAVGRAVDWVIDRFQGLVNFVKELPGMIGRALAGLAEAITSPVRSAWNWIADRISGIGFTVPDIVPIIGGRRFELPQLPRLARGGDIMRSGWAWVGEHGPEIVRLPVGSTVVPSSLSGAMVRQGTFDVNSILGSQRRAPQPQQPVASDGRPIHYEPHFYNSNVDAQDAADRLHWLLKSEGV